MEVKLHIKSNNSRITTFRMGFLMAVFLSFCYISFSLLYVNANTYDVTFYGAIGDDDTDDTNAFLNAWADVCGDESPNPTLVIPPRKSFLIRPISFNGPCRSESGTVIVKLQGNIVAPKTLDGWKGCIKNTLWLHFNSIQGLTINGPGHFNGRGRLWWHKKLNDEDCEHPTALHFNDCNGLRMNGTSHLNSPSLHISIINSHDIDLGNLRIIAPENSPNTDGIDIASSSQVNIHDCNIQTGDDCVAINGGIYDLNVTGVFCGPGHGISIGSLGERHGYDTVEKVRVENCNISGTANGGGTGYARGIVFQDILMENVKNPIIITQHYCFHDNKYCDAPPTMDAVQVSDVTYMNIYGSSMSREAIKFDCSGKFNCTEIHTNHVEITGQDVIANCTNAQGEFDDTNPVVSCSYS
ncbi:putative polygalacturonase At3g15720 [Bidens hawaiensis]|uniref:putative polygalacturonase At3g15720 n=1 Tax=Bidens hawaiensis TaxID=980011 RepID=UPI004049FCA8